MLTGALRFQIHSVRMARIRHAYGTHTACARHAYDTHTVCAHHLQAIGSSELNRKILRGSFILPEWLSSDAADLIHQMLTLSPERRITLEGIRAHSWLRGVAEAERRLAAWKQAGGGGGGADAADVASPRVGELYTGNGTERRSDGAAEDVDAALLRQVEQLGFSAEAVSHSVRTKAYDHGAALYHMLQRKAAVAKCRPAVISAVL